MRTQARATIARPPRAVGRRGFLKAAAAFAAPMIVPSRVLGAGGAVPPSDRIAIGMIGVGEHGVNRNMNLLFQNADAQIVAVCDVDRSRRDKARKLVDQHYEQAFGSAGSYKACDSYPDFREIIQRQDIDAVMVSTPDHWHVIPSIMAVRAGKDVICEKPLTLTVAEGRALSDEVARYGRIFQTSSENRTVPTYRRMCELVRSGRIGKLRRIEIGLPGAWSVRPAKTVPSDPPEGFDYDFWLGQTPWMPYCESRCHWNFRWIMDYSAGQLTDWGAHLIDIAQWGHNTELTGPVTVEGGGTIPEHPVFDTFGTFDLRYLYSDGVELRVKSAQPSIRFEGSDGWIESIGWRQPMKASSEALLYEPLGANDVRLYYAPEDGEHRNFLDCVKSRRQCYGPAEIGHRTICIAHIGNICLRLGRKLTWNPEKEQFAADSAANRMLSRAMREPWRL